MGGHAFDHGAQYFTVRDPRFADFVGHWLETGIAERWSGPLAAVRHGSVAALPGEVGYVGVPGMSALARDLLAQCSARFGAAVMSVRRQANAWYLTLSNGSAAGPFDVLVVATPPAQALDLVGSAPPLAELAREANMLPCWATVLAFASPLEVRFDAAFVEDGPLSWIARDSSKPGRRRATDTWVLHASAEWSQANLEASPESVREALYAAFETAITGAGDSPVYLLTHLWRYARPERPRGPSSLYDASTRIGFCGDWLTEGRVEAAALSGMELAERIATGAA
jgi:predicted NAD/FAD-dependent oxidoreductase